MDNATRKFLLQRHKQSGFPGSILDVFQAHNQGIDVIGQFEQQQNMQVAQTPQQQQQGLRPAHQAGNVSQSMIFPNVPPNTPFNTKGMKAPINIRKYDEQGHLVKSYENVPPGISNLPTGPQRGTVIETPANMQAGGLADIRVTPSLSDVAKNMAMREDSTLENIVEIFDPTGVSAWDDAYRAYNSMRDRGSYIPNVDEGLDMLGAMPVLGKAGKAINLYKKGHKPLKHFLTEAYNKGFRHTGRIASGIDGIEDETGFLDPKQTGGPKGDYNYERAKELGYKPDATGHYPSVDHETGMLLKSKEHPTVKLEFMSQMLSPERKMIANPTGYFGENQLQYVPREMQSGGVQDNTRVSMPTLPRVIPLDTSALQPPPDQGTIGQAGRAAPPNAMAFMPPGLQYNQMAAGKYIEENPLSNPVSLTAMGAFEALSLPAFGTGAATSGRNIGRSMRAADAEARYYQQQGRIMKAIDEGVDISEDLIYSSPARARFESKLARGFTNVSDSPFGEAARLRQAKFAPNSKGPLQFPQHGTYGPFPYGWANALTNKQGRANVIGQANKALRRGAAEYNLTSRRLFDRASGLVDDARQADQAFTSNRNALLRNLEDLYNTTSGGRAPRTGEVPGSSAIGKLSDDFVDRTMSGLTTNQAGGPRKFQNAGALEFGQTGPDFETYGPGLRIDGETYQASRNTGATRVPLFEDGTQRPILLGAAEVYDEPISAVPDGYTPETQALADEGAAGVAARRDQAAGIGLATVGDFYSIAQRYGVSAPLSLAMGKTPNLSATPLLDRAMGAESANAFPSEILGVQNPYGAAAVDMVTDPMAAFGLTALGRQGVKGGIASYRNYKDIAGARKFADKYKYKAPSYTTALSTESTDAAIRKMAEEHNTFARGVTVDVDGMPGFRREGIERELQGSGIDINKVGVGPDADPAVTKEFARRSLLTIPGDTGYGRAGLAGTAADAPTSGLYTSNSFDTAKGYTYGEGYIGRLRRQGLDFSGPRSDWLSKNDFTINTSTTNQQVGDIVADRPFSKPLEYRPLQPEQKTRFVNRSLVGKRPGPFGRLGPDLSKSPEVFGDLGSLLKNPLAKRRFNSILAEEQALATPYSNFYNDMREELLKTDAGRRAINFDAGPDPIIGQPLLMQDDLLPFVGKGGSLKGRGVDMAVAAAKYGPNNLLGLSDEFLRRQSHNLGLPTDPRLAAGAMDRILTGMNRNIDMFYDVNSMAKQEAYQRAITRSGLDKRGARFNLKQEAIPDNAIRGYLPPIKQSSTFYDNALNAIGRGIDDTRAAYYRKFADRYNKENYKLSAFNRNNAGLYSHYIFTGEPGTKAPLDIIGMERVTGLRDELGTNTAGAARAHFGVPDAGLSRKYQKGGSIT